MKTVILFRHAKSDWGAEFDADHERPLNERGERAARLMGRFLADSGAVPDRVISSSAIRARTTVELATAAGGWGCPVEVTHDLYETSPDQVLARLRAEDDAAENLLLAGHEPAWSTLAGQLIGRAHIRMPTAAMACVDFERSRWARIDYGAGTLRWLVTPKLLKRWKP